MRIDDNLTIGAFILAVIALCLSLAIFLTVAKSALTTTQLERRVIELERVMKIQVRINDAQLAAMLSVGTISAEVFQRYTTPPGEHPDD